MDVFGVAVEASSILLTVIQLVQRAVERQKELSSTLETYADEASETKAIIDVVKNEDALHTSGAVATIRRIETFGQELKKCLLSMGEPRSAIRQFGHQITRGSDDEQQLAAIMAKLGRAKQDLILQIQVANVGLTKTISNAMVVEVSLVNQVNALLQNTLGEGKGLKIADFLTKKGAALEADGTVRLSDAEYGELQTEELKLIHPDLEADHATGSGGKRIIVNNLTRGQALQINGPIAVDMWKDMAFIKIEGNVATDTSMQTNYPITMDVFREMLAARSAGIPAGSSKQARE